MTPSATQPTRILLIDDDIDDCNFFGEALKESGIQFGLEVSNHAANILKLLKPDNLPHLIFLDLNMPQVNGIECLREIRTASHLSATPVIIFSTSCIADEVELTFASGANLFVQKPAGFAMLKDTLKNVIQLDWKKYLTTPDRTRYVYTGR